MSNKKMAEIILLVAFLGFVTTFLLQGDNFWIGLLNAGFGAAMVGGLADLFAITALFDKVACFPHTDILRSKRAELSESIVQFATKDLLSVENIKEKVEELSPSQMLVIFLEKYKGRERFVQLVDTAFIKAAEHMDFHAVAEKLRPDMEHAIEHVPFEKVAPKALHAIFEQDVTADFLRVILKIANDMMEEPAFKEELERHVSAAGKKYDEAGDHFLRKSFRGAAIGSDADLSEQIYKAIRTLVQEFLDNPKQACLALEMRADDIMQTSEYKSFLINLRETLVEEKDIPGAVADFLAELFRKNRAVLLDQINHFLYSLMDEFSKREDWQQAMDAFVKEKSGTFVEENHGELQNIVRKALAEKSDDEVVALAKQTAGDDIHAIRLSGSCVGAVIGMVLYVVSFALERLWS